MQTEPTIAHLTPSAAISGHKLRVKLATDSVLPVDILNTAGLKKLLMPLPYSLRRRVVEKCCHDLVEAGEALSIACYANDIALFSQFFTATRSLGFAFCLEGLVDALNDFEKQVTTLGSARMEARAEAVIGHIDKAIDALNIFVESLPTLSGIETSGESQKNGELRHLFPVAQTTGEAE